MSIKFSSCREFFRIFPVECCFGCFDNPMAKRLEMPFFNILGETEPRLDMILKFQMKKVPMPMDKIIQHDVFRKIIRINSMPYLL